LSSEDSKDSRKSKVTINIRDVDEKLRRMFRAMCVEKGTTFKAEIQRLMKEALEKYNAEKDRRR